MVASTSSSSNAEGESTKRLMILQSIKSVDMLKVRILLMAIRAAIIWEILFCSRKSSAHDSPICLGEKSTGRWVLGEDQGEDQGDEQGELPIRPAVRMLPPFSLRSSSNQQVWCSPEVDPYESVRTSFLGSRLGADEENCPNSSSTSKPSSSPTSNPPESAFLISKRI